MSVVSTVQRGPVLVVSINRPEARNALDRATSGQLAAAFDRLDADDDLAAAVLTGSGGVFSAGMDLKAFARGERPSVPGRGLGGITETPPRKPVVAAIEGYALGGGLELALACDLIVVSETATLGLVEVARGLVAAGGGLLRLPRSVPARVASELVLTGRTMTGREAYEIRLASRLTSEGGAMDSAVTLAQQIAANGPLAVQASKRVMAEARLWDDESQFERQRAITDAVFASHDAAEGARAFAEKRTPVWTNA